MLSHLLPQLRQAGVQFRTGRLSRARPCAHYQVDARQRVLVKPKRLTNDPANTVSRDAAAGGTDRNGQAETRPTLVIQARSHAKESITKSPPLRVSRIEFRLATQAPLRGKSKPTSGRALALQELLSSVPGSALEPCQFKAPSRRRPKRSVSRAAEAQGRSPERAFSRATEARLQPRLME